MCIHCILSPKNIECQYSFQGCPKVQRELGGRIVWLLLLLEFEGVEKGGKIPLHLKARLGNLYDLVGVNNCDRCRWPNWQCALKYILNCQKNFHDV